MFVHKENILWKVVVICPHILFAKFHA